MNTTQVILLSIFQHQCMHQWVNERYEFVVFNINTESIQTHSFGNSAGVNGQAGKLLISYLFKDFKFILHWQVIDFIFIQRPQIHSALVRMLMASILKMSTHRMNWKFIFWKYLKTFWKCPPIIWIAYLYFENILKMSSRHMNLIFIFWKYLKMF